MRLIKYVYGIEIRHKELSCSQIDVAVNAPAAGTIKEFLANEEDTVTVGQDLVRMELGGSAEASSTASDSKEEPSSGTKSDSTPPPPPTEEKKSSPPAQEPKKESPPPKQSEPKASEPKSTSAAPTLGNREERRVRFKVPYLSILHDILTRTIGQNESDAS